MNLTDKMKLFNRNIFPRFNLIKYNYCTLNKLKVTLNEDVEKELENETIKPKQHPGISKSLEVALPANIKKSIQKLLKDFPVKAMEADAEKLHRYLVGRHPPIEEEEFNAKRKEIHKTVEDALPMKGKLDEESFHERKRTITERMNRLINKKIYRWRPIEYDQYKCLQYAIRRGPAEYAILIKILNEIAKRDMDFKPRSFLDFGAGIGTGTWAVTNTWHNSIYEYFIVDSSREMNDFSELILREGDENKEISIKNMYFRQFLPSTGPKYDLVLSSYSLFELPSLKSRTEILLNLWNKCDKYLILVEHGTNAGFGLLNEARNLILKHTATTKDAYIFAPCPHEMSCPRVTQMDGTPCNFEISYNPLSFTRSLDKKSELYSYLVIARGNREANSETVNWPRIIRPSLNRTKHTICRMCTKHGHLQEVIFTASKQGKLAYKCARSSSWGDRLPINFNVIEIEK